jgi:hypothetical protein
VIGTPKWNRVQKNSKVRDLIESYRPENTGWATIEIVIENVDRSA